MAHGGRFVGRGAELDRLHDLSARGERLVTIHGAAGMGKTRLAREYARRVEEEKAVFFVDLSTARSLDDAGIAVATTFELATSQLGDAFTLLVEAARILADRRPALVLLDNVEQLVDCVPTIVEPLLAVPGVSVLVTSREILRTSGEVVLELEPLSLPDGEGRGERGAEGGAARSDALDLLLDRVRRAGNAEAGDDVATCALIARQLDGIPLALELAAPRIALLGARAFHARLARPLDVLGRAPRDAARHQQSLRGALDGSWRLLEPSERSALAQCSLFRTTFDLPAFEALVAEDAEGAVDVLQSLHDKSLVRRVTDGAKGARFSLFLSVRDYAAEKLAETPEEERAARARFVGYHLERGRALLDDVHTARAGEALDELAAAREDLLAIVESGLAGDERGALEHVAEALLVLGPLYLARGPLPPLLALVDATLAAADARPLPPATRAELEILRGRGRHSRGEFERAADAFRAALPVARDLGLGDLEARAFGGLTASLSRRGAGEDVLSMFAEAALLHRRLGDVRSEGVMLRRGSISLRELGRLDEAQRLASRAVELLHEAGDTTYEALAVAELAYCALEAGDLATARAKAEQASRLVAVTGNWFNRALIGGLVSFVALAEGSSEEAAAQLAAGLEARPNQVGGGRYEGQARGCLGIARLELGDAAGAVAALEAAVRDLGGSDERRHRVPFEAFLGAAYAAARDFESADARLAAVRAEVEPADHRRHVVEVLAAVVGVEAAAVRGAVPPSLPAAAHASRTLAAASQHAAPGTAAFELRLALRHARRRLAALGLALDVERHTASGLSVDPEGEWFEREGSPRAALRRRPTLRALLVLLARAREASPGQPVETSRLVAAGWPEERMAAHAAKNRLAVALSTLRKLGLRDLLVADARGYYLDPTVALTWADRDDGARPAGAADVP